jgi:hypothetical protein
MHSPLLVSRTVVHNAAKRGGKEPEIENVAPFWALLRTGGPFASHNMEIDTVSFRDLGFEVQGSMYPKPPKGINFTASLPVARNVTPIYRGEVLTLPYWYARGQEDLSLAH